MKDELCNIVDQKELIQILCDMISINSINKKLVGGEDGEMKMINYIASYLKILDIPYSLQEVTEDRYNLIAKLEGKSTEGLYLESHVDTVSAENMEIKPFEPFIENGFLYGRGSCDAKGSVACMMYALGLLKKHNLVPKTDIYFAATVDEEYSFKGITKLVENGFRAGAAVVGEPTQLNIGIACKGALRYKIKTIGKAAHSSRPLEGRNAVTDMAKVICAINEEMKIINSNYNHKHLGIATTSITMIKGGLNDNTIPNECEITIDRRTLPGETKEKCIQEMKGLVDVLNSSLSSNIVICEPYLIDDFAMDTSEDENIVKKAILSCNDILGFHNIQGLSFSCDASKFSKAQVPSIVLGPGSIEQAHTINEFVEIKQLALATKIYMRMCL